MDDLDNTNTSARDDAATEAAVLQHVLSLHPAQVTLAELTHEMGGADAGFAGRDAIQRAVRDLTGAGLLHSRDALFVLPTRAALRFDELLNR